VFIEGVRACVVLYKKIHMDLYLSFHNFSTIRSKGMYLVETTAFVKTRANHSKKSHLNSKKITHVDDMMIHNLVKYLVQTQFRL